jgi:hypothetical protein
MFDLGKIDAAIAALTRMIDFGVKNEEILVLRGNLYGGQQTLESVKKAALDFDAAYALNPYNLDAKKKFEAAWAIINEANARQQWQAQGRCP